MGDKKTISQNPKSKSDKTSSKTMEQKDEDFPYNSSKMQPSSAKWEQVTSRRSPTLPAGTKLIGELKVLHSYWSKTSRKLTDDQRCLHHSSRRRSKTSRRLTGGLKGVHFSRRRSKAPRRMTVQWKGIASPRRTSRRLTIDLTGLGSPRRGSKRLSKTADKLKVPDSVPRSKSRSRSSKPRSKSSKSSKSRSKSSKSRSKSSKSRSKSSKSRSKRSKSRSKSSKSRSKRSKSRRSRNRSKKSESKPSETSSKKSVSICSQSRSKSSQSRSKGSRSRSRGSKALSRGTSARASTSETAESEMNTVGWRPRHIFDFNLPRPCRHCHGKNKPTPYFADVRNLLTSEHRLVCAGCCVKHYSPSSRCLLDALDYMAHVGLVGMYLGFRMKPILRTHVESSLFVASKVYQGPHASQEHTIQMEYAFALQPTRQHLRLMDVFRWYFTYSPFDMHGQMVEMGAIPLHEGRRAGRLATGEDYRVKLVAGSWDPMFHSGVSLFAKALAPSKKSYSTKKKRT